SSSATATAERGGTTSGRPEAPASRPNFVSPFTADSARKGTPRQEDSSASPASGPRIVAASSAPEPVILGSAAPMRDPVREPERDSYSDRDPNADRDSNSERRDVAGYVSAGATAPRAPEPRPEPSAQTPTSQPPAAPPAEISASQPQIQRLQAAVLQALADGNQRILVSMLEAGEWSVLGNELVIKIAESQTVIDMSLSPDARRLAIASASGVLGRAIKLRIVPGSTVQPSEDKSYGSSSRAAGSNANGAPGRSRAEQDPVVQRMREKFGAEIRTVIDYREKR